MTEEHKIFSSIPSAIAFFSAYCLLVSVSYNIGFFKVFDLSAITIMSIPDHIQNAILIMPFVFSYGLLFILPLKVTQALALRPSYDENKRVRLLLNLLTLAIILYIFLAYLRALIFPSILTIILACLCVYWVVLFDRGIIFKASATSLKPASRMFITLVPLTLFLMPFMAGEMLAYKRIYCSNQHSVQVNNNDIYVLMRYLDKGILVFSAHENALEFINWNEIKSLKYINQNGKRVCIKRKLGNM